MYSLDPSEVVIVTDTLATRPSGEPYLFVSKCAVIPHLEMVIVGTGIALVGQRWAHQLQTATLARNIDTLNQHVPEGLQKIEDGLKEEFGTLTGNSTIYHFGFSNKTNGYIGYAYRSEKSYVSELMSPGFGVKPKPSGKPTAPKDPNELLALAKKIRDEQDALSMESRVNIGGELVRTVLKEHTIQVLKIFRWHDFEQQWLTMNDNLR